jgi:hypothetical protein
MIHLTSHATAHLGAHLASHPAAHEGGTSARGVLLLIVGGLVLAAAYRASLRLHPYRNCRSCHGSGKHRGAVFIRSFRACDACGGTGRQLRAFAKDPN